MDIFGVDDGRVGGRLVSCNWRDRREFARC
jgi:hypothetical protein